MPLLSFEQLRAYIRQHTSTGSNAGKKSRIFGKGALNCASHVPSPLAHDEVIQESVMGAMGIIRDGDSLHIPASSPADISAAAPKPPTTFVEHIQPEHREQAMTPKSLGRKSSFRHDIKHGGHHYRVSRVLGRGSHGVVRLAYDGSKDHPVAIKIIDKTRLLIDGVPVMKNVKEARCISDVCKEHHTLRLAGETGSPFLPTLLSSFQDFKYVYFVMPRYYISLFDRLEELRSARQVMDMAELRLHAAEIILAVETLHHFGCFHCDIKPENIMFTDKGHLVLVDFSLSELGSGILEAGERGTPGYIPPEALDGKTQYSGYAADIYAMGVVLLQMYHCPSQHDDIFSGNGDVTVSVKSTWHRNEEVAGSLIQELMERNPDLRLPMGVIKAHPFFRATLDWSKVQNMEYGPFRVPCTSPETHHPHKFHSTIEHHPQVNATISRGHSIREGAGQKEYTDREPPQLDGHQHQTCRVSASPTMLNSDQRRIRVLQ